VVTSLLACHRVLPVLFGWPVDPAEQGKVSPVR
jgi:hypothetical protein